MLKVLLFVISAAVLLGAVFTSVAEDYALYFKSTVMMLSVCTLFILTANAKLKKTALTFDSYLLPKVIALTILISFNPLFPFTLEYSQQIALDVIAALFFLSLAFVEGIRFFKFKGIKEE